MEMPAELETELIIAKELTFIDNIDQPLEKLKRINALAIGLRKHLINK